MGKKRVHVLHISEREIERLLEYLKTISSITAEELKRVDDYYERLSVIYKHNRLIAEIRRLSSELREKGYNDKKHKNILDNVHKIETRVFVKFNSLIKEEKISFVF